MEMAQVKERTRTRTPSLAMEEEEEEEEEEASPKRRKIIINQDLKFLHFNSTSSSSSALVAEERCSSPISDESPASCCSSNGSFCLDEKIIKFSDLEVESAQVETSTCHCGGEQITRREMSLRTNSQEVESSMEKKKKPTTLSTQQKMPTDSELEEFFAAAEKDIQKRFQHKYNYDIVKDVPLEGRYEWVQLKP